MRKYLVHGIFALEIESDEEGMLQRLHSYKNDLSAIMKENGKTIEDLEVDHVHVDEDTGE